MTRVRVELRARSYDVLVGPGVRSALGDHIPHEARRAAVVTQRGIGVEVDPSLEWRSFVIEQGEASKSLDTVGRLCREFSRWGLTRNDVVVAVGGGVVTDVAGFAAATYHRGVSLINVPTTLLGQVDAAIGGKTGVNLPEGKNLVGAFWQPEAVLCDTDVLATLPPREMTCGFGEVAKCSFLLRERLEEMVLKEQIARCVALKADIVSRDERESGVRALLNYGHTLAHALETCAQSKELGWDLRHGEAVGVGLVFAARLACRLGRVGTDVVTRHVGVVEGYGLPSTVPPGGRVEELMTLMRRDKKATEGMTFVLDGRDGIAVVRDVSQAVVREALHDMGCAE